MSIESDEMRVREDMNSEFEDAFEIADYDKMDDLITRAKAIEYHQLAEEWKWRRNHLYANELNLE